MNLRLVALTLMMAALLASPASAHTLPTPPPWPHWEEEEDDTWTNLLTPTVTPTHTPTPTATPEPTPEFASYFPEWTRSKLTLHFIRTTPASYQFLRDARPPFAKLVDDVGWSATARRDFPEMILIGRIVTQNHEALRRMDPVRAATQYVNEQMPTYRANPDIDYWEGWNEWDPRTPEEWSWYVHFESQRACLMQYYGYRAVIGNFSTGRPEFNEMAMFLPALRIGVSCGAMFGLHEYSAPTMQFGYAMRIPRRPFFPNRGILTFRYRYWYDDMLIPLNIPIPLVITEMGVDGGVGAGRPGPTGNGWLDFTTYWKQQGLSSDGAQFYAEQLAWYDSEMRKDPYVLGASVYLAGAPGNSFDVEQVLPNLTAYVTGIQNP
jgi:hypothetical protein